jgi:hypothetical protein
LLAPFGLDASDPAFWDKGLSMIEGFIDELEVRKTPWATCSWRPIRRPLQFLTRLPTKPSRSRRLPSQQFPAV